MLGGGQSAPAGQRRQADLVLGGELAGDDALAAAAGFELGCAVVPGAAELVTGGQGAHAGDARPVDRPIDQALLTAVQEDVAEWGDSGGLVGDDDASIAPRPEPMLPLVKAADLAGDVAVDEGHEGGELGSPSGSSRLHDIISPMPLPITRFDTRRFDPTKLQKLNVAQTARFFLDVYCLMPGQAQKPHRHAGSDKVYAVLEGKVTVHIGGDTAELGPGQAVLAAAGVDHGVTNSGPDNAALLVMMTPPPTSSQG
jgi:quercetin dioxygenase-like cupin family protein